MVRTKRTRGGVLIIVLGVLAVLALLGTTFLRIQATERQIARNYLDTVRARLLAQSGVSDTVTRMTSSLSSYMFPDPTRPETKSWIYYGSEMNEQNPPQPDIALEIAPNPSFAEEAEAIQDPSDANTSPRQVVVEGQSMGFSASPGGTYGLHGDQYSVKVIDLSGMIHVNDGVGQYGGISGSVTQNLRRLLNRLGDVITVSTLGDRIIDQRPLTGYQTRRDLEAVLGTADYERSREFLTTNAWVDWGVANPVPLSASHVSEYPVQYWRGDSQPLYRFGRGIDAMGSPVAGDLTWDGGTGLQGVNHGIYGLDELNPQWIEVVGRAPVNVNQARKETLIALLSDLQGFFISHRRRNSIETVSVGGYYYPTFSLSLSPAPVISNVINVPSEGDEFGFLYKTARFKYLGSGTTSGAGGDISAEEVADHIIACRNRQAMGSFDYGSATWGGPFKSWRQFNAFCDNLVTIGVLEDKRDIFYDYSFPPSPGNITGYGPLIASDYERAVGSQALADVLKANFNPNLHLNELNPDANLYLEVDKTDLLVNSTEFVFTPTGYYEIESVGRVLRPAGAYKDALLATNNDLMARHKIVVGVRLFDLYRETNQKQFGKGTLAGFSSVPIQVGTNSNASLEVGPEVDNGPAPLENEWDGYVALPTLGGLGVSKASGALEGTPAGGSASGEAVSVHFTRDYDASVHMSGERREMAQSAIAGETMENFPDPGESYGGPYDPVHGSPGRHRLARSFRLPGSGGPGSTGTLPSVYRVAPEDLRIDGGYSERHSTPGWWITPEILGPNVKMLNFAASFWVKPSFPPDKSGKPRMFLNAKRHSLNHMIHGNADAGRESWLMCFFNAGHDTQVPGGISPAEDYGLFGEVQYWDQNSFYYGFLPFRPQCIFWGRGYGARNMVWWCPRYYANTSAIVNHEGHGHQRQTKFREHEWMHITVAALPRPTEEHAGTGWESSLPPIYHKLFINGVELPGTMETIYLWTSWQSKDDLWADITVDWTTHFNGDRNSMRFGAPSKMCNIYFPERNNYASDATIDEFKMWNDGGVGPQYNGVADWLMGRYAKPLTQSGGGAGEGVFISQGVQLVGTRPRMAAPSNNPGAGAGAPPPPTREMELLGLTWTYYGQDASDVTAAVIDASNDQLLPSRVEMYIRAGTASYGPFTDDGFTTISEKVAEGEEAGYTAQFRIDNLGGNTILLATPVLDDVTLYFRPSGGPTYLYYVSVMTTLA